MKYYLYIDESDGTSPDRGAQDFLTIGGVLVSEEDLPKIDAAHQKILKEINASSKNRQLINLHSVNLRHEHKVYLSKRINGLPVTAFCVVSNRKTYSKKELVKMNEAYEYGNGVKTPTQHYHINLRLLLEMVGAFVRDEKIKPELLEIIIEKSGHSVADLQSYIHTCKRKPKDKKVARVRHIWVDNIRAEPKGSSAGLDFADHVAHSLYRAFNREPKNMNMTETRYFNEMKNIFGARGRPILD